MKGAVYGIYSEDGTKVTTITTDVNGKATSSSIKLGKYYPLEETAPAGYVLNTNKIHFELTYARQTMEITSTDISQVEQEQKRKCYSYQRGFRNWCNWTRWSLS